ncbi:MAG: hypothetical protein ACO4CG_01985 [Prochlorothrix sp.]|nr:hypothetical protein [Prochlorothrix sp.]
MHTLPDSIEVSMPHGLGDRGTALDHIDRSGMLVSRGGQVRVLMLGRSGSRSGPHQDYGVILSLGPQPSLQG